MAVFSASCRLVRRRVLVRGGGKGGHLRFRRMSFSTAMSSKPSLCLLSKLRNPNVVDSAGTSGPLGVTINVPPGESYSIHMIVLSALY